MKEQYTKNDKSLPNQRVSDKTKQALKFRKRTADYRINEALGYSSDSRRTELLNMSNGIIADDTFDYITMPFSKSKDKELKEFRFPISFEDTGLIKDILLKLMSEYSLLNHNYQVHVNNPDIILKQNAKIREQVNSYMEQAIINHLNQQGMDTGIDSKELPDIEQFVETKKEEWFDQRAIDGQNTLEAIRDWTKDELLYREAYFTYIVLGEYYMSRKVYGNQIVKENIDVKEAYPIPNSNLFVNEYDGFLWRREISIFEVLSHYEHELEPKDIKYIKELISRNEANNTDTIIPASYLRYYLGGDVSGDFNDYDTVLNSTDDILFSRNKDVLVNELIFQSEKKIGILTSTDKLGNKIESIVTEDYILNEEIGDINLEWDWIVMPYRMLRIGDDKSGIYTKPKPLLITEGLLSGLFKNKLNISGKRGLFRYDFDHSIVKRLGQYEVTGRLISAYIKHYISKGLLTGDVQLIPESILHGGKLSSSQRLIYMISDGRLMYNDSDPQSREAALTGFRYVASANTKIISTLIELYNSNKSNAWDSIGWNRQRDGQSFASDGKGVTQQMLSQSMKNIGFINEMFNKSRENDYSSDLAWSKIAFINATTELSLGNYRGQDGNVKTLAIDGTTNLNTEYITYVENSAKEEERLAKLRDIAFAAAQNGEYVPAMEATLEDSTSQVKKIIKELTKLRKEEEERRFQAEQENLLKIKEMETNSKKEEYKDKFDLEFMKETQENYRKVLDVLNNNNNEDGNRNTQLKERIQAHNEQMDTMRNKLERDKMASSERIAKENKKGK